VVRRGRRPTPGHLRLIEGTSRVSRHGTDAEMRKAVDAASHDFGPLIRPKSFKGEALYVVTDRLWEICDIVRILEDWEAQAWAKHPIRPPS